MVRRVLILVGALAAGLVVLVMAALATAPGHALVRRLMVSALARAVDGRVKIGSLSGALWHTAELRDVELATLDGHPVIRLERLKVSYALLDLVRRRFVFSDVQLDRPTVVLEAGSDGNLNIERVFRLLGPRSGPPGRRALVALEGVHLVEGTLVLRERPDSAGAVRVRRFLGIRFDATRLRISHPDSVGVEADIRHFAVAVSDPPTRVEDASGRVVLAGDSVRFDFTRLRLAGTSGTARGTVRWGRGSGSGRAAVEVAANLARASFADFRWAVHGLPERGGGRVVVRLRLFSGGGSDWRFRDADLRTGRSRLRGSVALVVERTGAVRIDSLDVDAEPLDLALLVPFLGPAPVAGLLSGHLTAAGTPAALGLREDLTFVDEGVSGRPSSRVTGAGTVTIGGRDGFAFHRFSLTGSDVAVATIERLAPAVTLRGRLALSGTLDGPWRDAAFAGTIRHADSAAASLLRGTARLTLADTVRVSADLVADSLSLDDLARSYPVIGLRGSVAGPVRVSGPVTALAVEATLSGPGGGVHLKGDVTSRDSVLVIRFGGSLDSLDLAGHLAGAPGTRLTGEWRVEVAISEGAAATTGTAGLALAGSRVAGFEMERAGGTVLLTAQRIEIDTLYVDQPGLSLRASGALGLAGQPAGQLSFVLHADTLANLESLVAWAGGVSANGAAPAERVALHGAGRISGRLVGTVDAWEAQGELVSDNFALGSLRLRGARVRGSLQRSARGLAPALRAAADTLDIAGMRYTAVVVTAEGPLDSARIHVGGAFALGSSLAADFVFARDSAGWGVRLENGALTLPQRVWTLAPSPRITVTRDWIAIDTVELRSGSGGRVRVGGRVPLAGAGDVSLSVDSLPIADLYALAQQDTTGIGGVLSGTLRLSGTAAEPSIRAAWAVSDGRVGDFRAPRVDVAADYDRQRLAFRAGLWSEREQVMTASGSLPLDLALRGVERRRLPDSLLIRVRADSVDLEVLGALTSVVRDVRGQLTADAEMRGTWDRPALRGSVRISGGAATIPALGVRYTGIEARVELEGDRLALEEVRLTGGSGTLDVAGEVRFEALAHPVVDLTLTARGFAAFTKRDFAGLTASGKLRLTGPLIGATLGGRMTVDAGFLAFADLVNKRIVNLDDPEFQAMVDSNLVLATDRGASVQSVFLDSLRISGLTVAMGPDVWLRSHEANIQMAGEFTVAKEIESGESRYRLDGELRAERGTYRLVVGPTSKEFRVTRGTVRFFGTPDLNPVLDIVAEHSVQAVQGNDLVVRAVIGGTLLVPRLSLESDERPPLTETEIVSYLMFGRPSFDLASSGAFGSSSEQAVFQGALVGLAGVLSGELEQTLVTDLGIPVDYIAIRTGGGSVGDIFGSTRVEAGKQIGERTFLILNAGLCQGTHGLSSQALGASVEYRLTRRWSMEASVEPTVQECRQVGFQIRPPVPYQIGLDLFWQSGVP